MIKTEQRFQATSESVPNKLSCGSERAGIVLIGFMGVGKTAVGRICAKELGYEFCCTDTMIEARAGQSIAKLFETQGEAEFRRIERAVIAEACKKTRVVIATGGGAPLDPINAQALRSAGTIVQLTARPHTVASRLGDASSRPLLAGTSADETDTLLRIKALMRQRRSAYGRISQITVPTDSRSSRDVAHQVIESVEEAARRCRETLASATRLVVDVPDRSYPIWMASGLVRHGGGHLLAQVRGATRACLVTHPHLRRLYAEPLAAQMERCGIHCAITTIPDGESHKRLRTVERLYSAFIAAGLDRSGLVVAVGGGVIGDIAGFAAATFLRGVRCAQVPTTLLAQVDSSVGGKTGVDVPEGKNLVGAFHQPAAVLLDPATLASLPVRELKSGLAEVIKYGIISDRAFFYQTRDDLTDLLNGNPTALTRAIARSCEIKAAVVCEDETEQGVRAILNFGHTVGHALESATQYMRYRHGEAISIGMVTACLVGEELGITPPQVTLEIAECLSATGLPVEFPADIDTNVIQSAMLRDKKTYSGRLRFIIADQIGRASLIEDIPPALVDTAIERQKPS